MGVKTATKQVPESPPADEIDLGDIGSFNVVEARKPKPPGEPLPPLPSKALKADQADLFFDWVAALKPEHWQHCLIYMYRFWPVIDRKLSDPNNAVSIDKLASTFTIDSIKEVHGSGKYNFIVCDSDKVVTNKMGKAVGGKIGEANVTISDNAYPPKLRLDELDTGHPDNKRYVDSLVIEGKLTPDKMPVNGMGAPNAANDPQIVSLMTRLIERIMSDAGKPVAKDSTVEAVTTMLTKANDTTIAMLKDNIKSDDPEKMVKLMAAIKDLLPKADTGTSMLELVVKMQSDAQSRQNELMSKLFDVLQAQNKPSEDFDKQIDRMIKMQELFGANNNNGSAKKSTVEVIAENVAPIIGKVLDTVGSFLTLQAYAKGASPQAMPPMPQALPTPATSPEQTSEPASTVVNPVDQDEQLKGLLRGPAGPLILSALERGESGDAFAESVETMFGKLTYDQLFSIGKDKLVAIMQTVPEFWARIVPATLDRFMDEFFEYGKQDGIEEVAK